MMRVLILLPLLAACAPVPLTIEKATRQCRAEVGQADGVSGSIGAGISNRGPVGSAVYHRHQPRVQSAERGGFRGRLHRETHGRPARTDDVRHIRGAQVVMRAVLAIARVALAGCNAGGSGGPSIAVADSQVEPGLASCLATIGRADVAVDPAAPMSDAEISELLDCTAERATR